MPQLFALADLSMDDRSQLLTRALEKQVGRYGCYIRDVYDTNLVYYDYDDGATYRCDYSVADDLTVTFGESVEVLQRSVYEPVKMGAFSLSGHQTSAAGCNVYANSLLFEIQSDSEHFPGQGITVTKQDLADIARSFSGATMGLEHLDTVLGDACGDIRSVWLDSTGRRLFGDVAIPKGLDALIPPGPRRVSVEICRDEAGKMSIPKVDLVLSPQIERAALMSLTAFSKSLTAFAKQQLTQLTPLSKPSLETRPMPENTPPAPNTAPEPTAAERSLWDRFKAFCKIEDAPSEPAHFADPQVAEFRRKAQLHDAAFGKRKEEAKKAAVIGFDAAKAGRFSALIDATAEGIVFDELEAQATEAAAKVAPPEGGRRTTTPPAFGSAQDADAADGTAASKPALESSAALFARRAEEARRGSVSTF